jgi:manganese transport protein
VRWDVSAAMLLAGTVNATMLVMAGGLLRGSAAADSLAEVPAALDGTVGGLVGLSFALALLASGVASTSVGCLAGQVVMGGLLRRTVPVLARRLVALAPGLLVLGCGADPTLALVLSQVVLSFGIPFAVIPLVRLTARRSVMGPAVNHRATTVAAAGITAVVVAVNVMLIGLTAGAAQLW